MTKQAKAISITLGDQILANHPDQVVRTGDEIESLDRRYYQLDEENGRSRRGDKAIDFRNAEMKQALDRIDALREYLSCLLASSPEGAIFQLREVVRLTLEIQELSADDSRPGMFQVEKCHRQIQRLLYSIDRAMRPVLPRNVGVGIPRLNPCLDPWKTYPALLESFGALTMQA